MELIYRPYISWGDILLFNKAWEEDSRERERERGGLIDSVGVEQAQLQSSIGEDAGL